MLGCGKIAACIPGRCPARAGTDVSADGTLLPGDRQVSMPTRKPFLSAPPRVRHRHNPGKYLLVYETPIRKQHMLAQSTGCEVVAGLSHEVREDIPKSESAK